MKILMISSYLPYPLYDGGRIRLYNLLRELKNDHEITLICETRENQLKKDIDEVEKICKKVITFERPKAFSLKNIIKSLFSFDPFLITVHSHQEFKKLIENEINSGKYDLIHVETFYVMQNLPKTKIPIVLVEHNIEYEVYEKYAGKSSPLKKPILYLDALKIRKAEEGAWLRANKLIAVSGDDQKRMGDKTVLVPNGVDIDKFSFKEKNVSENEKRILFIGNFKWIQNKDSAVYIIKSIWPHVKLKNKAGISVKLWVVGKNIPDGIKKLATEDIIIDENAPDETEQIFQRAAVLLSPIRAGGGTNFKILEAMSCGTPVVTNLLGNKGLDAKENEEILTCEEPVDFAEKLINLLSDRYLYEKISKNSRAFIVKNYDWKKIARKLDQTYKYFV